MNTENANPSTIPTENSEFYNRTKKAKRTVDVMIRHIPENTLSDIHNIFDEVKNRFDADERLVVSCGHFIFDKEANRYIFKLPSTAKVINYFKNGIDRYEAGYTKLIIHNPAEQTDNVIVKTKTSIEWIPDEFLFAKTSKTIEDEEES